MPIILPTIYSPSDLVFRSGLSWICVLTVSISGAFDPATYLLNFLQLTAAGAVITLSGSYAMVPGDRGSSLVSGAGNVSLPRLLGGGPFSTSWWCAFIASGTMAISIGGNNFSQQSLDFPCPRISLDTEL
jgi:hypothetical protein